MFLILACTTAGDPVRGATLYDAKCAVCHGDDGTAGIDGAASLPELIPSRTDEEILTLIREGTGEMPGQYPETEDAADVLAFLREEFG